jgi:hypothetical protein
MEVADMALTRTFRAVAVAGAVLLAAAPAGLARQGADDPAGDDRGGGSGSAGAQVVRTAGACSLRATAKLKLKTEDAGRVEVEFEVDENRRGSVWGVTLTRNGTRVVSRRARTTAPSGSFTVRALVAEGASTTRVVAVARRAATGEVCRATARI